MTRYLYVADGELWRRSYGALAGICSSGYSEIREESKSTWPM